MRFFEKKISSVRIFIIGRFSLGLLLCVYWFQLFQDRNVVFFTFSATSQPTVAGSIGALGLAMGALIAVGVCRRALCFLSAILMVMFIWFSPFVANVSIGYLTFLLLVLSFVPEGERWFPSLNIERDLNGNEIEWEMPEYLFWVIWIVGAVSYTESGIDKILHPVWRSGDAVNQLFNYSLAVKENFISDYIAEQPIVAKLMTWGVIALETVFVISLFFKRVRWMFWLAMVILHLSIMSMMAIYYISFGMLVFHAFMISRLDLVGLSRPPKRGS